MRLILFLLIFFITHQSHASDPYSFISLNNGWTAFAIQDDPFDTKKKKILHMSKGNFTFDCKHLNVENSSDYISYDGFNFSADMKYKTDKYDPVNKKGSYSTYYNGSDMINNRRVFSFKLSQEDIQIFKVSNSLTVAARALVNDGWSTYTVSLKGFTAAYDKMCM